MRPAIRQKRTYTQNSQNAPSPYSLQLPPLHFLCSSPLILSSERKQSYGGDDGQTNNCVATAVDLRDFEAFADVPKLI